jgi:hypothetical protein
MVARGRFSRPLLPRHAVSDEEKVRQLEYRVLLPATVGKDLLDEYLPFVDSVREEMLAQGFVHYIGRPEQDPLLPVPTGLHFVPSEVEGGYASVTADTPAAGRAKSVRKQKVTQAAPGSLKITPTVVPFDPNSIPRTIDAPVIDLTPVFNRVTTTYPIPFRMVDLTPPREGGQASYSAAFKARAHQPPDADQQWEMLVADLPNVHADYLKDADFQHPRAPAFQSLFRSQRSNPYNQLMFTGHPSSAYRLTLPTCDVAPGLETPYFYVKCDQDFFRCHSEQNGNDFLHHCLRGSTQWYLVSSDDREKFFEVVTEFLLEYLEVPVDLRFGLKASGAARMARVLFYSKNLMMPPAYLRDAGIPVAEVTLNAGEVLMVRGNWIHWGLNLSACSIGAAINYEDEFGMLNNPPIVGEVVQFVSRHHPSTEGGAAFLAEWKARCAGSSAAARLGFLSDQWLWSAAMHQVPFYWTCQRLVGQRIDLWKYLVLLRGGFPQDGVLWREEVKQRKMLLVQEFHVRHDKYAEVPEAARQAEYARMAQELDLRFGSAFGYSSPLADLEAGLRRIDGQFFAGCFVLPLCGADSLLSLFLCPRCSDRAPCGRRARALEDLEAGSRFRVLPQRPRVVSFRPGGLVPRDVGEVACGSPTPGGRVRRVAEQGPGDQVPP